MGIFNKVSQVVLIYIQAYEPLLRNTKLLNLVFLSQCHATFINNVPNLHFKRITAQFPNYTFKNNGFCGDWWWFGLWQIIIIYYVSVTLFQW